MLENKPGTTNSAELARIEEKVSKQKALEMFETGYLDSLEAGKYKSLVKIYKSLFDEIYDFAGEIRKVNISKGNFRFAPPMYLDAALQSIDKMPQSNQRYRNQVSSEKCPYRQCKRQRNLYEGH